MTWDTLARVSASIFENQQEEVLLASANYSSQWAIKAHNDLLAAGINRKVDINCSLQWERKS